MMHDRNGAIIGTSHMTEKETRTDISYAQFMDKLAAVALISAPVATWMKTLRMGGSTWSEIQAEWRKLELIVLGDRKKVH